MAVVPKTTGIRSRAEFRPNMDKLYYTAQLFRHTRYKLYCNQDIETGQQARITILRQYLLQKMEKLVTQQPNLDTPNSHSL